MSNQKSTPAELRKFGIVLGLLIAGVFGLLLPWLKGHAHALWPWMLMLALVMVSMAKPLLLLPVYRGWMKLGAVLGWVNTRTILGVIFFAILLPMALVLRLLRRDPLQRRFDSARDSYLIESQSSPREQLEKPY